MRAGGLHDDVAFGPIGLVERAEHLGLRGQRPVAEVVAPGRPSPFHAPVFRVPAV